MTSLVELYFITKLVSLLTKDWKDTEAFKLGILDEKGKVLKKSYNLKTAKEKAAYSIFFRFVYNLKRIIESLPGGKTKLAKYIAVWSLFREETELSDFLDENYDEDLNNHVDNLFEEFIIQDEHENI